jgi:hypothetical protein
VAASVTCIFRICVAEVLFVIPVVPVRAKVSPLKSSISTLVVLSKVKLPMETVPWATEVLFVSMRMGAVVSLLEVRVPMITL